MIVFKFTKTQTSALAAHVDTLRAVTYLLRRAEVNAAYSQGFNPHIELGFSPPLPLGVESVAEYVSVKADFSQNILAKVNAVCPKGMSFTHVWQCDSVNLAAKIDSAHYKVNAKQIGNYISEILAPNYMLVSVDGDKVVQKDVSSRILSVNVIDADNVELTLKVGNENLRPDKLILQVLKNHNLTADYSIIKDNSFVGTVSTDSYLDSIAVSQN